MACLFRLKCMKIEYKGLFVCIRINWNSWLDELHEEMIKEVDVNETRKIEI